MADISNIKVGEQNYTIGLSDDDMSRVKRMTAGTEEKLANTGANTADVVPSITLNSEWDEENSIWKPFKFVTPFAASEMPKKLNVSLIFYYGKEDTDNIYPKTNGKPPIDFTNLSITFTCANTDYTVDQDHWDITSFIDEYQDGFIYYPSGFAKLELIICCEQDFTAGTYKFSAYPTYDVSQIHNKFNELNTHLTEEINRAKTTESTLETNINNIVKSNFPCYVYSGTTDLNNLTQTGIHLVHGSVTNGASNSYSMVIVEYNFSLGNAGTPYQIQIPDNGSAIYKRYYSGGWTSWVTL